MLPTETSNPQTSPLKWMYFRKALTFTLSASWRGKRSSFLRRWTPTAYRTPRSRRADHKKIEKSMVLLDQWLPEELIALNRQINSKKAQIAEIQSQINTLTQSQGYSENTILPADYNEVKEILSDLRQERYAIERNFAI